MSGDNRVNDPIHATTSLSFTYTGQHLRRQVFDMSHNVNNANQEVNEALLWASYVEDATAAGALVSLTAEHAATLCCMLCGGTDFMRPGKWGYGMR